MSSNIDRLANAVDRQRLAESRIAVFGCGASHHLVTNLARCGVGHFTLVDPDCVGSENICRTDYLPEEIGHSKVAALGQKLRRLSTIVTVQEHPTSAATFFKVRSEQLSQRGGRNADPDLLIAATDSFPAQAAVNQFAVKEGIAALYVGVTLQGLGGEIVFWHRGLPCFRCLMAHRYEQLAEQLSSPTACEGVTLFDTDFVDAIAGQIALGLLLRRTETRFGRLITALGDRNFLRVKIDPHYRLGGRDLVRSELGIPANNEHFIGWCVSALRDPDRGQLTCGDCQEAGHQPYHDHE